MEAQKTAELSPRVIAAFDKYLQLDLRASSINAAVREIHEDLNHYRIELRKAEEALAELSEKPNFDSVRSMIEYPKHFGWQMAGVRKGEYDAQIAREKQRLTDKHAAGRAAVQRSIQIIRRRMDVLQAELERVSPEANSARSVCTKLKSHLIESGVLTREDLI
ncbi:hypothetical protein RM530_05640 [Algiphilus sp. W345]|uniref:Uncharacterized protein n=1 Tax=Banduia mediterranea TaxID=3075609 RepID=A0ABU2WG54_9GAMM|nr:hypothetical protein [Algiphilus sp. W345]MDT0496845.1 hypothetical protein [Algiphilus sp. W345]